MNGRIASRLRRLCIIKGRVDRSGICSGGCRNGRGNRIDIAVFLAFNHRSLRIMNLRMFRSFSLLLMSCLIRPLVFCGCFCAFGSSSVACMFVVT